MAAKPTSLPRWANVGALIIEPTSAKKNVGWAPGEKPPAQYENWRTKLVYDWTNYLNDGALEGNHTFDANVTVRGSVRVQEDIGNGDNFVGFKAAATLAGDFDYELPATLPGSTSLFQVTSAGVMSHTRDPSVDTVTAVNNITSSSGDVVATAGNIIATAGFVETSEDDVRHTEYNIPVSIPYVNGTSVFGSLSGTVGGTGAGGAYYTASATEQFAIDLPFKLGDRIKRVKAIVFDNDGGGGGIALALWKQDAGIIGVTTPPGTLTQISTTKSSINSVAFQLLDISGLTETVINAQTFYRAHFALISSANVRLYGLIVTVDRVA